MTQTLKGRYNISSYILYIARGHRINLTIIGTCAYSQNERLNIGYIPVVTPAVSSGRRVVDGYVRVGPNRWSRRDDVSGT